MNDISKIKQHAIKVCLPAALAIFTLLAILTGQVQWINNITPDTPTTLKALIIALFISSPVAWTGIIYGETQPNPKPTLSTIAIFYITSTLLIIYAIQTQNPTTAGALALTSTLSMALSFFFIIAKTENNILSTKTIKHLAIAIPPIILCYFGLFSIGDIYDEVNNLNATEVSNTLNTPKSKEDIKFVAIAIVLIATGTIAALTGVLSLGILEDNEKTPNKAIDNFTTKTVAHTAMYAPIFATLIITKTYTQTTNYLLTQGALVDAIVITTQKEETHLNVAICALISLWLLTICVTTKATATR